MVDDRDELIERIRAVLREPPAVDASAKARVLIAVAAERERDREPARRKLPSRPARWLAASASLLAAAALVTWFGRQSPSPARVAALAPEGVAAPLTPGGAAVSMATVRTADAAALRPVQLVFREPSAHRVSVVGDFTDWDANQAPMTRDSASGLWSVSLALRPGRHVYAFLVDDTLWVQDPRAMEARDADFGRPGSVLLVGGTR